MVAFLSSTYRYGRATGTRRGQSLSGEWPSAPAEKLTSIPSRILCSRTELAAECTLWSLRTRNMKESEKAVPTLSWDATFESYITLRHFGAML